MQHVPEHVVDNPDCLLVLPFLGGACSGPVGLEPTSGHPVQLWSDCVRAIHATTLNDKCLASPLGKGDHFAWGIGAIAGTPCERASRLSALACCGLSVCRLGSHSCFRILRPPQLFLSRQAPCHTHLTQTIRGRCWNNCRRLPAPNLELFLFLAAIGQTKWRTVYTRCHACCSQQRKTAPFQTACKPLHGGG